MSTWQHFAEPVVEERRELVYKEGKTGFTATRESRRDWLEMCMKL
jgi:hypothetical protein